MELASAGINVDLYDKNERPLTQASAQNEGKIHLGYVYAGDRTLRTARAMIKGGISFAPLMRRWIGGAIDAVPVSTPFRYVVHRESLIGAAEVEEYFRACHALAVEEGGHGAPDYFGSDYRVRPRLVKAAERDGMFDAGSAAVVFDTGEIGLDPEALAEIVRDRLAAEPKIRCILGAHVYAVSRADTTPAVRFRYSGERLSERYDHVVNTLWDGRLAIDRTAGVEPARPWLYRVKHYLRVRAPALASAVPSTTTILGPFGDIAAYESGVLYLSWYPAGMRGASRAIRPPPWPLVLDDEASSAVRRSILEGLAGIVPAIARFTPETMESCELKAGIIVAWGETDIRDPASGLHERHAIGPASYGRYHTVETGKLTMAPLFGKMVADRIRQTA